MLKKQKSCEKGNATLEMIPVLALFLLLVNFGMGFFGIIHSGILNSIAARNYAFESFRNRSNLNYLRDEAGDMVYYSQLSFRVHAIVEEGAPINTWKATQRPIRFTDVNTGVLDAVTTANDHNQTLRINMTDDSKATSEYFQGQSATDAGSGVSPAWIMTSYGICLNPTCEG